LRDERQKQQILSVNNDLKAPVTPMGHGDAFFSIGMALTAAHDANRYKVQDVGNLASLFEDTKKDESGVKKMMERLQNAGKEGYNNTIPVEENHPDRPNPDCTISECSPAVWVPENKLCLLCLHRG
jgi:hypothetical protein